MPETEGGRRFEGECEIMGHKVDLARIRNPNIVRAIKVRVGDFLFSYGDSNDYGDRIHTDEVRYKDYTERSSHSDDFSTGRRKYAEHTDRTTHSDYSGNYVDSYYDW